MMEKTVGKTGLILVVLVAASCIKPTKGAFGIPDFLEFGQCFNATLVDNFDPVKYQGLWFDIQSVPNEYQAATQCNSNNYTWAGDRMIAVGKGLTDEGKKVKQISELLEELELREPPHPAHMTVIAEGVPESPYQVIATDYVTYSCVHSCLEYFGFKAEFFWVFGRTPTLPNEYVTLCHDALINMGVDPTKMTPVPQGEICPYATKLDQMLETNRQFLDQLGLPESSAPPLSPTLLNPRLKPTTFHGTRNVSLKEVQEDRVNVQRVGVVEVKPRSEDPFFPKHDGETSLEAAADSSSAPLKTSNNIIPLFVLIAVLLPIAPR